MPRTPVYEQVIADVVAAIEAGTLKPGDKLPSIAELRERYESSAWPIRYALRILDERGWIETHQGKGSFIKGKDGG